MKLEILANVWQQYLQTQPNKVTLIWFQRTETAGPGGKLSKACALPVWGPLVIPWNRF